MAGLIFEGREKRDKLGIVHPRSDHSPRALCRRTMGSPFNQLLRALLLHALLFPPIWPRNIATIPETAPRLDCSSERSRQGL